MEAYVEASNRWLESLVYTNDLQPIYHYTSPEGLKGIFDNQVIRFTNRLYLNDKSEGIYVFDVLSGHYDEIFPSAFLDDESKNKLVRIIDEFRNGFADIIPFKVYQASFSLNKDSLPLWNYYTKGAGIDGYNIEFISNKLADSIVSKLWAKECGKHPYIFGHCVIYQVDKQVEMLRSFILELYTAIRSDNGKKTDCDTVSKQQFFNRFSSILERILLIGTIFKSSCFTCEEEYRLFINPFDEGTLWKFENEKVKRQFNYKNGLFIPYIDLPFEFDSINSITFSPTLSATDQHRSLKEYIRVKSRNNDFVFHDSTIPIRY